MVAPRLDDASRRFLITGKNSIASKHPEASLHAHGLERFARRRKLMATTLEGKRFSRPAGTVFHPIVAEDKTAMAVIRPIVEPNKGRLQKTAARVAFDAIMERVAVPSGVTFEAGTVGGIPGWWCRPQAAPPGAVVLHIHGGWFTASRRSMKRSPFPAEWAAGANRPTRWCHDRHSDCSRCPPHRSQVHGRVCNCGCSAKSVLRLPDLEHA